MRIRIESLRVWLLVSAVFLIGVIAAFMGYARFLTHLHHLKLPANLGIDVQSDANGVTYSHEVGGRTTYKIHAARQTGYTNGKFTLHDVAIELYGKDGNRRDRIYGDVFEYDQKEGVVRAVGLVHMDLQAADTAAGSSATVTPQPGAKVLHVTTSGLVYLEKLGVAATSEDIEFEGGLMKGHARGADYTSDSGMLLLHSAVSMTGTASGRPVQLDAATAEFDNRNHEAFLTHATYVTKERTAMADQATLHARADGSVLERVEARGNVKVVTTGPDGGTVTSERADVQLNGTGQPKSAVLTGAVRFTSEQPLRQAAGQANEVTIAFDQQAHPQPARAVFTGAVKITERTRTTEAAKEPWSVRDLTAEKVDSELVPVTPARGRPSASQLRNVEATGNAHLTVMDTGSLATPASKGETELAADDLKAVLKDSGREGEKPELDTIAGRGHTLLHQIRADGMEQTSTGDVLDARFRAGAAKTRPAGQQITETLWTALQQGNVTMTRVTPAKAGAHPAVDRATAARGAYDGDADRVTLTGGVRMTDAESVLWANEVALNRTTGDSLAVGGVKVDYNSAQPGGVKAGAPGKGAASGEPTHVLADRAELVRATEVATFYGKPVRLWQGGSQVQAPVVEFARAQQRLIARGEASTGWSGAAQPAEVHTVLMSAPGAGSAGEPSNGAGKGAATGCPAGTGAGKVAAGSAGTQTVRIASGGLIYSGILREADFTGGVRADTADSTIRATGAIAYLDRKEQPAETPVATPSLAGNLDRVVASGHVEVASPGMQASGARLLYTAADGVSLLTGDKDAPPRAVDAQGTTTAAALRFHSSCGAGGGVSVEAVGDVPGEPVQRVRTDSRVTDPRKKEKGNR